MPPVPTVTSELRERLKDAMHGLRCPSCGTFPGRVSLAALSEFARVPKSTISYFLSGRSIDSDQLDRLSAWADSRFPVPAL